jgi:chorismate-pyruvate lyase
VFAQTVMPDSTLSRHPWLAEMGEAPLDETLNGLTGVERSSFEYAWLRGPHPRGADPAPGHPLAARALRGTDLRPAGLWARRTRVTLRGSPLLMQEAFLPAMGRV